MTSDIHHYHDGKPLNRSETIKRQLERDAARLFMRQYEQRFDTPMRDIWHNEPAKPDISCHLNNQPLDLEIAHLYASASEAKLLTEELIDQVDPESHPRASNKDLELLRYLSELVEMNSQQRLQTALTHILNRKAEKHYDSKRVWLVIRNASPIWQNEDFDTCMAKLHLQPHPFEKIWLLPDFSGEQPAIQLFPTS